MTAPSFDLLVQPICIAYALVFCTLMAVGYTKTVLSRALHRVLQQRNWGDSLLMRFFFVPLTVLGMGPHNNVIIQVVSLIALQAFMSPTLLRWVLNVNVVAMKTTAV